MIDVDWWGEDEEEASTASDWGDVFDLPSFKGRTSRGVKSNENTTNVVGIATWVLKDFPFLEASDGEGTVSSECFLSHDNVNFMFIGLIDEERNSADGVQSLAVPGEAL